MNVFGTLALIVGDCKLATLDDQRPKRYREPAPCGLSALATSFSPGIDRIGAKLHLFL